MKRAVAETGELLASAGHQVAPRTRISGRSATTSSPATCAGIHDDVERVPYRERLERRTRGYGRIGGAFPAGLLERARAAVAADAARISALFERFDVLITPVMGGPRSRSAARRAAGRCGRCSISRASTASRRSGTTSATPPPRCRPDSTEDGMPLAVQLIGRPGDEATLLSLAAQIEAERPWAQARPPLD